MVLVSAIAVTIYFLTWSNTIRSQYLIPNKKDTAFVISAFAGAAVNLILNFIFIPLYGAMGAVIGTIFAELTVAILHTCFSFKKLNITKMLLSGAFYLVPGVIMAVIVRIIGSMLGQKILTLVIQIVSGSFIYIFISVIYMHLSHNKLWLMFLSKLNYKNNCEKF